MILSNLKLNRPGGLRAFGMPESMGDGSQLFSNIQNMKCLKCWFNIGVWRDKSEIIESL
jgi:hypothetical protein